MSCRADSSRSSRRASTCSSLSSTKGRRMSTGRRSSCGSTGGKPSSAKLVITSSSSNKRNVDRSHVKWRSRSDTGSASRSQDDHIEEQDKAGAPGRSAPSPTTTQRSASSSRAQSSTKQVTVMPRLDLSKVGVVTDSGRLSSQSEHIEYTSESENRSLLSLVEQEERSRDTVVALMENLKEQRREIEFEREVTNCTILPVRTCVTRIDKLIAQEASKRRVINDLQRAARRCLTDDVQDALQRLLQHVDHRVAMSRSLCGSSMVGSQSPIEFMDTEGNNTSGTLCVESVAAISNPMQRQELIEQWTKTQVVLRPNSPSVNIRVSPPTLLEDMQDPSGSPRCWSPHSPHFENKATWSNSPTRQHWHSHGGFISCHNPRSTPSPVAMTSSSGVNTHTHNTSSVNNLQTTNTTTTTTMVTTSLKESSLKTVNNSRHSMVVDGIDGVETKTEQNSKESRESNTSYVSHQTTKTVNETQEGNDSNRGTTVYISEQWKLPVSRSLHRQTLMLLTLIIEDEELARRHIHQTEAREREVVLRQHSNRLMQHKVASIRASTPPRSTHQRNTGSPANLHFASNKQQIINITIVDNLQIPNTSARSTLSDDSARSGDSLVSSQERKLQEVLARRRLEREEQYNRSQVMEKEETELSGHLRQEVTVRRQLLASFRRFTTTALRKCCSEEEDARQVIEEVELDDWTTLRHEEILRRSDAEATFTVDVAFQEPTVITRRRSTGTIFSPRMTPRGMQDALEAVKKAAKELKEEEEAKNIELQLYQEARMDRVKQEEIWGRKQVDEEESCSFFLILERWEETDTEILNAVNAALKIAVYSKHWEAEEEYWRSQYKEEEQSQRFLILTQFQSVHDKLMEVEHKQREWEYSQMRDELYNNEMNKQRVECDEEFWRCTWIEEECSQRGLLENLQHTWACQLQARIHVESLRDLARVKGEEYMFRETIKEEECSQFLLLTNLCDLHGKAMLSSPSWSDTHNAGHVHSQATLWDWQAEERYNRHQVLQDEACTRSCLINNFNIIVEAKTAFVTNTQINIRKVTATYHNYQLQQWIAEEQYWRMQTCQEEEYTRSDLKCLAISEWVKLFVKCRRERFFQAMNSLTQLQQDCRQHIVEEQEYEWSSIVGSALWRMVYSPSPTLTTSSWSSASLPCFTLQDWEIEESYARGVVMVDEREHWSIVVNTELNAKLQVTDPFLILPKQLMAEFEEEQHFSRQRIVDYEGSDWTQIILDFTLHRTAMLTSVLHEQHQQASTTAMTNIYHSHTHNHTTMNVGPVSTTPTSTKSRTKSKKRTPKDTDMIEDTMEHKQKETITPRRLPAKASPTKKQSKTSKSNSSTTQQQLQRYSPITAEKRISGVPTIDVNANNGTTTASTTTSRKRDSMGKHNNKITTAPKASQSDAPTASKAITITKMESQEKKEKSTNRRKSSGIQYTSQGSSFTGITTHMYANNTQIHLHRARGSPSPSPAPSSSSLADGSVRSSTPSLAELIKQWEEEETYTRWTYIQEHEMLEFHKLQQHFVFELHTLLNKLQRQQRQLQPNQDTVEVVEVIEIHHNNKDNKNTLPTAEYSSNITSTMYKDDWSTESTSVQTPRTFINIPITIDSDKSPVTYSSRMPEIYCSPQPASNATSTTPVSEATEELLDIFDGLSTSTKSPKCHHHQPASKMVMINENVEIITKNNSKNGYKHSHPAAEAVEKVIQQEESRKEVRLQRSTEQRDRKIMVKKNLKKKDAYIPPPTKYVQSPSPERTRRTTSSLAFCSPVKRAQNNNNSNCGSRIEDSSQHHTRTQGHSGGSSMGNSGALVAHNCNSRPTNSTTPTCDHHHHDHHHCCGCEYKLIASDATHVTTTSMESKTEKLHRWEHEVKSQQHHTNNALQQQAAALAAQAQNNLLQSAAALNSTGSHTWLSFSPPPPPAAAFLPLPLAATPLEWGGPAGIVHPNPLAALSTTPGMTHLGGCGTLSTCAAATMLTANTTTSHASSMNVAISHTTKEVKEQHASNCMASNGRLMASGANNSCHCPCHHKKK